jgi:hypothetical protein
MAVGSARIRTVPADCDGALTHLDSAARFLRSADAVGLHPEAQLVLLYDAARNAATAVLLAAGKQVGDGRGSHVLAIREAGRQLGDKHRPTISRLDTLRALRNRAEYEAQPASTSQVAAARLVAVEMIAAAAAYVTTTCPGEVSAEKRDLDPEL